MIQGLVGLACFQMDWMELAVILNLLDWIPEMLVEQNRISVVVDRTGISVVVNQTGIPKILVVMTDKTKKDLVESSNSLTTES